MRDHEKILHSILIVSGSSQFDTAVKKSLPGKGLMAVDFCNSAAAGRRRFFEQYYDIVVINFPLPDETGAELAFDIAEKSSTGVVIAAPSEIFSEVMDHVTDAGILVISKPIQGGQIGYAIRLLSAIQDKFHRLEEDYMTVHEKMEELRLVGKAKCLLIERRHMTEDEAHRYIGKEAMNNGVSRKRIAEKILDDYD